nr:hypothetical protein [Tanacetum cinerariifolium]
DEQMSGLFLFASSCSKILPVGEKDQTRPDEQMSGLFLFASSCSKILPVGEKGLYGLNKLFLNPISIVNVRAMNDTPKNLKHMMSWPIISNSFTCKTHVDHGQDGSPRWSHKRIVIVGWTDIESIYENIFVKIEPLLIQLTTVQPSR